MRSARLRAHHAAQGDDMRKQVADLGANARHYWRQQLCRDRVGAVVLPRKQGCNPAAVESLPPRATGERPCAIHQEPNSQTTEGI